jgi:OTU domain-containing protein 6
MLGTASARWGSCKPSELTLGGFAHRCINMSFSDLTCPTKSFQKTHFGSEVLSKRRKISLKIAAVAVSGFTLTITAAAPTFVLQRITGDGRCLFRSLAQGAHIVGHTSTTQNTTLLPFAEETSAADMLRAAVCEELLRRQGEMEPFIDDDFAAYVQDMRQASTWGGEPELAMSVHVLQRPVAVYTATAQDTLFLLSRYGEDEYAGQQDVALFFHGAGHYDLLLTSSQMQSKL